MKKLFYFAAVAATMFTMASCSDDETEGTEVSEVIDVDNFKIKANSDGTIQFVGDVSSNAKIKKFIIEDLDGNKVYDFLESNTQVKEKNNAIDENGEVTKEKKFNLTGIESGKIPVGKYKLYIKTKNQEHKKGGTEIGEDMNFTIGAKNSNLGSYLSIEKNQHYDLNGAKENGCEVVAVSDDTGYKVVGLKKGSDATSTEVKAKAGKVALYKNSQSTTQIGEGDVIITASGCICKINKFVNTASGDATIEAIIIKETSGLKVDVSGSTANFSK